MSSTVFKLIISYLEKPKYIYSLIYLGVIVLLMNNNLGYGLLFLGPMFLTYMTVVSIFIEEKSDECEKFICSLPLKRKEIVTAKYLNLIVVSLINIIICIIGSYLVNMIGLKQLTINVDYILLFLNAILIFAAVLFPVFFYMDNIKIFGKLSFIIFIIIALGKKIFNFFIKILGNYNKINQLIKNIINSNNLYYFIFVTSIILFILSYEISTRIYKEKEF